MHAPTPRHDGPDAERQTLERLRDEHPGWQITHAEGKDVPWIAIRHRSAKWRGGHPVCEATTPDELERLIAQAVETDAKVVARSERCTR